MEDITSSLEFKETTFLEKLKKNPSVPIGFIGLISIVGYGLYNFKKRGTMKASVYIIHTRLAAQGAMIGCLTIGLLVSMTQKNLGKLFNRKD